MDSKLNWNTYIAQTTHKKAVAFATVLQITVLIWGPFFKRTRLLSTVVVRPAMLYSAQIWGLRLSGKLLTKGSLTPLVKLQNQCLHKTIRVYKRTLCIALNHKAAVPPLNLYIDTTAMQKVVII